MKQEAQAAASRDVVLTPAAQKEAGLETEIVELRSIPEILRANGRITDNQDQTWRVGAVTEGRIVKVFAKAGDEVQQGQILARMHSHIVHESRAEYRKAVGELARAKGAESYSRSLRDRARRLFELKAASLEQVEHAETELRNAQTAVAQAEIELDRTRRHLVEFLEIPADEAEYHRDGTPQGDEDYIPIKAPASGTVIARNVTAGMVVGTTGDLFVLSDLSSLWMIAAVSEEHLPRLRVGMPVRVSVQAYPGRVFPGRVARLGEELDPTTRTLKVRVDLPNRDGRLKPEMYATAEIELGGTAAAVFIPQAAPQEIDGRTMVFVRKGESRFEVRPVSVARTVHLEHRWFVLIGLAGIVALGLYTVFQIPIEAFPDLTNNQVVVITECPAMAPTEVEQLVTFPIETALMGLPKTQGIRSISKLGLSMVTLVFDDSVNIYFARQIVGERLQEVRTRLPQGLEPGLGPVATAFGEVYQYTVSGEGHSAMDLKTLHEWLIKNQLRTLPGVNEVNTWGGETRQYQVEADPARLQSYGLSLRDIYERIRENNGDFGGGFIEHSSEQYTVRGLGRLRDAADLEQLVVLARGGTPVLLRDVAAVSVRPMPRQGAVLRDGKGETVSGMVIMLKGENGKRVIERVKQKLASLRLPGGVRLIPFYDQSDVIDGTIRTVKKNLFEGGILVVTVLLLFLGEIRAALIVAAVIPLSMLVGFIGMRAFGVSANLMSLGAIDFGMIVDGAVVMMENSVRRLHGGAEPGLSSLDRIREAAHEVARPIVFGVAIIIAVYMPIFFLEDLEGRMFRPMAITVCAALIGSLIFALTVVPAAAGLALRRGVREHKEARWFALLRDGYLALLRLFLRWRIATMGIAVAVLGASLASLAWIGTDFMPRLDEGSLLIQTRKLPGISLTESIGVSDKIEKIVRGFPEVQGVVSKLGRPDLATEAMGIYEADVYVLLKPRGQWQAASKEELIEKMSVALERVPGVVYNFTQPMAMRLDETVSGIKADVALKIFGEDPRVLEQLAERALGLISSVPGAADTQMEIVSGVAELRVQVDRQALARYGLNVSDVRDLMDATIGGRYVSDLIEGQRRFAIVLRLPERYRQDPATLGDLLLSAPGGERIRLAQVARIEVARGPEVISRENGQRRIVVQANVRGRDLGSYVAEAAGKIERQLALPAGYSIDWGGQFENQQRATRRLMIVLPASILIIFGLLFSTFNSVRQAILILLNVPFALVGGIAALWARGLTLNLSASVGFIALFGVAVLNGIVLVSSINALRQAGVPLDKAIYEGAATRFRPVLMTALVASLGFLPMALATSTGAEIQRPLASAVIGGLITSTGLTLFLLPILYQWFCRREPAAAPAAGRL